MASQMRAVRSADAVARRVPSGLQVALYTALVCPFSTASGALLWASHMRAVSSPREVVAMRVPSGLQAALSIEFVSPFSTASGAQL